MNDEQFCNVWLRPTKFLIVAMAVFLAAGVYHLRTVTPEPAAEQPAFDESLVLTPLYVEYLSDSDQEFRNEANELKRRIGAARNVLLGFGAQIHLSFPDIGSDLGDIDKVVQRAETNGLVVHISLISGFFHAWNPLRERAIRDDVRNAQWFADGLIAPAADLKDPETIPSSIWITPSRYALPLRTSIEEGVRALGAHLAGIMARSPDTLVTISGDGEVEYTFERSFGAGAEGIVPQQRLVFTDYSPFMVAEFRDLLRKNYTGDLSPATDENADGRTFNQDFGTRFVTWRLKYFDSSGPIPFSEYVRWNEKLPASGPNFIEGGFDAPREPRVGNRLWEAWAHFRRTAVRNWVLDFGTWITGSPDPESGFRIPASRYFTHQIPADFLFGQPDNLRLRTSASPLETAIIRPVGSTGVTAFNTFNGKWHSRTATPALFSAVAKSSDQWGIPEYNPSIPPTDDEDYYLTELRQLYAYRPRLIVPFAWTDSPELGKYSIKGSAFERGLRRFVAELAASGGGGN